MIGGKGHHMHLCTHMLVVACRQAEGLAQSVQLHADKSRELGLGDCPRAGEGLGAGTGAAAGREGWGGAAGTSVAKPARRL